MSPITTLAHAIGQPLSPAVRALRFATVHGGAGGGGLEATSIGSHCCGGTARGVDEWVGLIDVRAVLRAQLHAPPVRTTQVRRGMCGQGASDAR